MLQIFLAMTITSFNHMPVVRINAPEWYHRADWMSWLNYCDHRAHHPATWHRPGAAAGEFSDVFFTYHQGDGSDSPEGTTDQVIPADIWSEIDAALRAQGIDECLVWVSNLAK